MAAALDLSKHQFAETASKGRWIELSEGGEVLVARWNNPQFRQLQTKLYQEYRRPGQGPRIKGNTIPGEVQEKITFELVVKTIVMDWRGFMNGAEELECEDKTKRTVLGNEQYRWIFDEITAAAMDEEAYRQGALEDDLGNSQAA